MTPASPGGQVVVFGLDAWHGETVTGRATEPMLVKGNHTW